MIVPTRVRTRWFFSKEPLYKNLRGEPPVGTIMENLCGEPS
jgi:hypothetical protein